MFFIGIIFCFSFLLTQFMRCLDVVGKQWGMRIIWDWITQNVFCAETVNSLYLPECFHLVFYLLTLYFRIIFLHA